MKKQDQGKLIKKEAKTVHFQSNQLDTQSSVSVSDFGGDSDAVEMEIVPIEEERGYTQSCAFKTFYYALCCCICVPICFSSSKTTNENNQAEYMKRFSKWLKIDN